MPLVMPSESSVPPVDGINRGSYFDAAVHSKWFAVALLVGSVVIGGGFLAFGVTGLFAPTTMLPQWLAAGIAVVGYNGCLAFFISGATVTGVGGLTGISLLFVKAPVKNRVEKGGTQSPELTIPHSPEPSSASPPTSTTSPPHEASDSKLSSPPPILLSPEPSSASPPTSTTSPPHEASDSKPFSPPAIPLSPEPSSASSPISLTLQVPHFSESYWSQSLEERIASREIITLDDIQIIGNAQDVWGLRHVTGEEAAQHEKMEGAPDGCSLNLSFKESERGEYKFFELHKKISTGSQLIKDYQVGIEDFIDNSLDFDFRRSGVLIDLEAGITISEILKRVSVAQFMVVRYPTSSSPSKNCDNSLWGKGLGRIPKQWIHSENISLLSPLSSPEHFGFKDGELETVLKSRTAVDNVFRHIARCHLEALFLHMRAHLREGL